MKKFLHFVFVSLLALSLCTAAAGEVFTLPASLETIEEEAFADCESLSGVLVIPTDVQVDETAFDGMPDLIILRGVAVVGDDTSPSAGTLDGDVWTAVSEYCKAQNVDCTYTTDAGAALQNGYDTIITVGFMASDAVSLLQTQYPDARFICLDSSLESQEDNVYCVLYQTRQAGFMAGYAAVRMGFRSLGFLGGAAVTDVVSYGDGFIQGANQAAAELNITDQVTVARNYTGTFEANTEVFNKAAAWYDARVEIIFCCGGNMCQSVIQAANAKGRWMIGVDTDQSVLGNAVVTSAMKNLGFSAVDALTRILAGSWDSLGGTCQRLGVVSSTSSANHVCLAPGTQFSSGFSASDYASMVTKLYSGTYPSGKILITVTSEP